MFLSACASLNMYTYEIYVFFEGTYTCSIGATSAKKVKLTGASLRRTQIRMFVQLDAAANIGFFSYSKPVLSDHSKIDKNDLNWSKAPLQYF